MGLKDWMFGSKKNIPNELTFGRYSDLYKDDNKQLSWEKALKSSEEKDHLSVYRHFMDYISDDQLHNVVDVNAQDKQISFSFFQGSKKVKVVVDNEYISAEVKIANCIQPNIEVFRELLEENNTLNYSKFCLDNDGYLVMLFESPHSDANPFKLYDGLKELATIADHKDDGLIERYPEFEPVNTDHIRPISSYLLRAKFEYFNIEISTLNQLIDEYKLTNTAQLGSLAFLVNAFVYKIDYLLVPEGRMMQILDRLVQLTSTDSAILYQNIEETLRLLKLLQQKKEPDLRHEFYHSIHTFGVTGTIDHAFVSNFIETNLEALDWYISNQEFVFSNAVCTFVIGKLLYDYTLPEYDKELAHLFFRVTEPLFFASIGMKGLVKNGIIKKGCVLNCIEEIEEKSKKSGVVLNLNKSILNWENHSFPPSFLIMLSSINPIVE